MQKRKAILFILSYLSLSASHAFVLYSPFPSQIAEETGIQTRNARFVGGNKRVLRSMRPWVRDPAAPHFWPDVVAPMAVDPVLVDQILNAGVTDILIFKDPEPGRDDIQIQKDFLATRGMVDADKVVDIPADAKKVSSILFPWKEFKKKNIAFKDVCSMTVKALKRIKSALDDPERKILFHCTVGEDRTGYLAFLFNLLNAPELSTHPEFIMDTFVGEACRGGYSTGNAGKPDHVSEDIKVDLTPLLTKMAFKVYQGELKWSELSEDVCNVDPEPPMVLQDPTQPESPQNPLVPSGPTDPAYKVDLFNPEKFVCEKSPDYPENAPAPRLEAFPR